MGLLDQVIGGVLGSRMGGGLSGGMGSGSGMGGIGGLLGGGGMGGSMGGGLGSLLGAFQQSGHGDVAQSWVNHGENRPIAPNQLMDALGPDTVDQLQQQTGMPRDELLSELSHTLPHVVDKLTPDGRLPTDD